MRKLVAGFAVSLDGYMEGPNGEYDWMTEKPAPEFDFAASAQRFDTFLMGRKTYEKLLPFGSGYFPGSRQYVFSRTLEQVEPGFTLIRENVWETVNSLKNQPGKDISLFGGASLLASLLEVRVVDEISMMVIPILLGSGKPMVGPINQREWLELNDVKTYSNGNVQLTYTVISSGEKPKSL